MPSFCVVLNCCDKYGHAESISFHKFPFKRKDLFERWIEFAQRGPDWKPTKWSSICSQHFTAEDFKCVNSRKTLKKTAVPTVNIVQRQTVKKAAHTEEAKKITPTVGENLPAEVVAEATPAGHLDFDFEDGEEIPSTPEKTSSSTVVGPKTCCRLCGVYAATSGTFSTNFEIFGMIQKCFPTLNIQQDDNLPKDLCNGCLRRLKSFSEFIDKVLETQCDLQLKYRIEKHTKSMEQRPLKIKQEPVVVKVKQEVAEGFDSFLSDDLDVGMDDCCEPEPEAVSVDQKFGFCDFPMLNAQDIINNCDIMEIINLDDPFINIPDDDAATINVTEQVGKTHTPSAHQLLQTHMLIDEHNYACPAEDLKEEWQIKKCCKTEETEADLYEPLEATEAGCEDDYQDCSQAENTYVCSLQTDLWKEFAETERSAKPIVTSVSAIARSRLDLNNGSGNSSTANISIGDLPSRKTSSKPDNVASNKPNIVVLNESIVKSTEAFQLHACEACQLKFFSIESLQQHVKCIHETVDTASTDMPMSSLPVENVMFSTESHSSENMTNTDESQINELNAANTRIERMHEPTNDREEFLNLEGAKLEESSNTLSEQFRNLQSWQFNMKTLQLNAMINTWTHGSAASTYQTQEPLQQDCAAPQPDTTQTNASNAPQTDTASPTKDVPIQDTDIPLHTNAKTSEPTTESQDMNSPLLRKKTLKKKSKALHATTNSLALLTQQSACNGKQQQHIATDYKYLQRRYRALLRKCKALEGNREVLARATKGAVHHICPHCPTSFTSIYQLLQHKQRFHRAHKVHNSFSASCFGCEKYFLSKRALTNHMKYICQSMSLRWFKTQLQTFKCRACCSISFTHWRLFRNHEIQCHRKMELKRRRKLHHCPICERDLTNALTLAEHMTAEHGAKWQLRCEQCSSKFRRISAILQHHCKGACKLESARPSDCAVKCCNCEQSFRHISKILAHHHCRKGSTNAVSATAVKKQQQSLESKVTQFPCNVCRKVFSSMNHLCQHRITHSQVKRHKCGLCARVFKRRGGLTQHMKGFHLQLKPYECPVCKHHYALKCDMQRCKHSTMQRRILS